MEKQIPDTPEALPGDAVAGVTPAGNVEEIVDAKGQWVVWAADKYNDWGQYYFSSYADAKRHYDTFAGGGYNRTILSLTYHVK